MNEEVCRDPEKLVPELKQKLKELMMDIAKLQLPIFLFETLRTEERQKDLFERGVSHAQHSKHQDGLAFDLVVMDPTGWTWSPEYDKFLDIAGLIAIGKYNLNWGGNWEHFHDPNHFELRLIKTDSSH